MLGIFLFSRIISAAIPSKYASLVKKARTAASRPKNGVPEQILEPNSYDFEGISFTLNDRLIGPTVLAVKGHAIDSNVLALVIQPSDEVLITPRTIFVDPETQTFHHVNSMLGSDGDAFVYSITEKDPTVVFANLRMKTTQLKNSGYNCGFDAPHIGARCNAWYGYNWDKGNDKPNPKPLPKVPNVNYYAGAIGEAQAGAEIHFHGFRQIDVDFDFSLSLTGGLGLELEKTVFATALHVGSFSTPVYGHMIKILGVKIGFELSAFVDFDFQRLAVELPERLIYYRSLNATLSRAGKISTKGGLSTDPWHFSLTPGIESTIPASIGEFFKSTTFEVSPELNLGIAISLQAGKLVQSDLKIGATTDLHWRFSADKDLCNFPYLIGTTETSLTAFADINPLKVLGHEFIKPIAKRWPLYDSGVSPRHCLLSKPKSSQNDQIADEAGEQTEFLELSEQREWTVLEAEGATIAADHKWVDDRFCVVSTKGMTRIPYKKAADQVTIKVVGGYDGTKDGFCHSDTVNPATGCVELNFGKTNEQKWIPENLEKISLGSGMLYLLPTSERIARIEYEFAETSAAMLVNDVEKPLSELFISCDRCTRVAAIENLENGERNYLEKSGSLFVLKSGKKALLVAESDDPAAAFCEITEDFGKDGVAVYSMQAGIGVDGLRAATRALGAFPKSTYVKRWEGKVSRVQNLPKSAIVIKGVSQRSAAGEVVTLTPYFGEEQGSFGSLAYSSDPEAFIERIGEDAEFTDDGKAVMSAAGLERMSKDPEELKKLFDVPADMISTVSLGEMVEKDQKMADGKTGNGTKPKDLGMGAIIAITIGAACVLCVIVVVSVRISRKDNALPPGIETTSLL